MDTSIIFEAYIKKSAHIFKNIIELLSQVTPIKKCNITNTSIKQIFLKITESAIYINTNAVNSANILVDICLDTDMFCSFKYKYVHEELNIGINLNILKTFFKHAKKPEGVVLRISKDRDQTCPSEIEIGICSEDNTSRMLTIKFSIVQNILINYIEPSLELTTMSNYRFLSICKEMGPSKKLIKITAKDNTIVFSNNESDVAIKSISFHTTQDILFTAYSKSEYIKNIAKLSTFNDNIQMFKTDNYIIFKLYILKSVTKFKVDPDYIGYILVNIKLEPEIEEASIEEELLNKIYT
jgi:hypothetical protein